MAQPPPWKIYPQHQAQPPPKFLQMPNPHLQGSLGKIFNPSTRGGRNYVTTIYFLTTSCIFEILIIDGCDHFVLQILITKNKFYDSKWQQLLNRQSRFYQINTNIRVMGYLWFLVVCCEIMLTSYWGIYYTNMTQYCYFISNYQIDKKMDRILRLGSGGLGGVGQVWNSLIILCF